MSLTLTVTTKGGNTTRELQALIDTGSEVCLVKRGLFPVDCFEHFTRPVTLTTANSQRMAGGVQEALLTLEFAGRDRYNAQPVQVSSPSLIYEADISQDIILSYAWLAERGFDVCPKRLAGNRGRKNCVDAWKFQDKDHTPFHHRHCNPH